MTRFKKKPSIFIQPLSIYNVPTGMYFISSGREWIWERMRIMRVLKLTCYASSQRCFRLFILLLLAMVSSCHLFIPQSETKVILIPHWRQHTQRHKSMRITKINLKEKRKLDQNLVPFILLCHSTVSDLNLLVVYVYGLHGSV